MDIIDSYKKMRETGIPVIDRKLKDSYTPISLEDILHIPGLNCHPQRMEGQSFSQTCARLMNERVK